MEQKQRIRQPAPADGTPPFNIADETTWPLVLKVDQVAAIYQKTVCAVQTAVKRHRFIPVPFQAKPMRWRKADLLRHIDGGRGPLRWDSRWPSPQSKRRRG